MFDADFSRSVRDYFTQPPTHTSMCYQYELNGSLWKREESAVSLGDVRSQHHRFVVCTCIVTKEEPWHRYIIWQYHIYATKYGMMVL
jgi:hypothetical protein